MAKGQAVSGDAAATPFAIGVRWRCLVFAIQIAAIFSVLVGACRVSAHAQIPPTCKARVKSLLLRFVGSGEIFNDNELDSLLRQCGDYSALADLLDALARPALAREPLEIIGAIEAALRSPELANNAAATGLIIERFDRVRDPGARASLSYMLARRNATQALNRILRDDPTPEVRSAAALSLSNCKTRPDFAALWRAAELDPNGQVRAQAYQTLDRFGQLTTPNQLLAASRAQTDAPSTGRFLGKWLKAEKASEEKIAETLTRLAEHTGQSEASGALSEISTLLQPPPEGLVVPAVAPPAPPIPPVLSPAARMAPIRSRPIAAAAPEESDLQRALYLRRERITRVALAQFAASKDMREDAARGAIDCALGINRCGPSGCQRLGEILRTTDRMAPALALEASHDISSQVGHLYFSRRFSQYAFIFSLSFLFALAMLVTGWASDRGRVFAIGTGWLLILSAAAAIQFTSGDIMGVSVWPPPWLWPATALGSIIVTLLVAAAATLVWPPKWIVPAALIAGELGWWLVPSLLAAHGITLRMQHYSDEDWLPFMLDMFMPVGGPLLTLAVSKAAWRIQRLVLPAVE